MKADILARYADRQMPRYTSYPTAPHFAALGADDYRSWLAEVPSGSGSSTSRGRPPRCLASKAWPR